MQSSQLHRKSSFRADLEKESSFIVEQTIELRSVGQIVASTMAMVAILMFWAQSNSLTNSKFLKIIDG